MVHEQLPVVHYGEDFDVGRWADRLQMPCLGPGHERFKRAVPEMDIGAAGISQIPIWLGGVAIIFAVLIAMIAGFFPSLRAMKLSPLAAIRAE